MIPKKVTVLRIEPQTHVRSTKGDSWLFAVTDEYLEEYDAKRAVGSLDSKPGRNVSRKRQLEKYNAYKEELRWIAKKEGFAMPMGYFCIWFCIPFPKSWEPRKSKCRAMENRPHTSTPDADNLIKAFFDGILPRKNKSKGEKGVDDRKIHCYTTFKIWVKPENACVKIIEYNEQDFMSVFNNGVP